MDDRAADSCAPEAEQEVSETETDAVDLSQISGCSWKVCIPRIFIFSNIYHYFILFR